MGEIILAEEAKGGPVTSLSSAEGPDKVWINKNTIIQNESSLQLLHRC